MSEDRKKPFIIGSVDITGFGTASVTDQTAYVAETPIGTVGGGVKPTPAFVLFSVSANGHQCTTKFVNPSEALAQMLSLARSWQRLKAEGHAPRNPKG